MEKMTVTRGLTELKTLDSRINKAISSGTYIEVSVGEKPVIGYKSKEEYNQKVQSSIDSVNSLIKRRDDIKSAIVSSNAKTMVKIGNVDMTVAKAIEGKESIAYKQAFLNKLKNDYRTVLSHYNTETEKVKDRLDTYIQTSLGKDTKLEKDQIENISKPFMKTNEIHLNDPSDLKMVIEKIEKEIEDFLTEVDFTLSESNAITQIEI